MPSYLDRQAKLVLVGLICLLLPACLAAAPKPDIPYARAAPDPQAGPQAGAPLTPEELRQRLGQVFVGATGGAARGALQELLHAERLRGEEARALLLLEAFYATSEPSERCPILFAVSDVPRPVGVPYMDKQLGLEPRPPGLYSSAAGGALRRLVALLRVALPPADQARLPAALQAESRAYVEAGQFLEAAGALTLARALVRPAGRSSQQAALQASLAELAQRRRCVARVIAAAQPALVLAQDPEGTACAMRALQLLSSRPEPGPFASRAAQVLLQPALHADSFAAYSLLKADPAPARPLWRGDPEVLRRRITAALDAQLQAQPGQVRTLLGYLGKEPRPALTQARRDDLLLAVLFRAAPQPELAPRLSAAYAQRNPVVADAQRYVSYLGQVYQSPRARPAEAPGRPVPLLAALRDPDDGVVAVAVAALTALPPSAVEDLLSWPLRDPGDLSAAEQQRYRERVAVLRAVFRLPVDQVGDDQLRIQALALDVHRCCRGDLGSCDRRGLPAINQCPAWVPLRGW